MKPLQLKLPAINSTVRKSERLVKTSSNAKQQTKKSSAERVAKFRKNLQKHENRLNEYKEKKSLKIEHINGN